MEKSGFVSDFSMSDINQHGEWCTRDEAENWAKANYNWLKKIEKP